MSTAIIGTRMERFDAAAVYEPAAEFDSAARRA